MILFSLLEALILLNIRLPTLQTFILVCCTQCVIQALCRNQHSDTPVLLDEDTLAPILRIHVVDVEISVRGRH